MSDAVIVSFFHVEKTQSKLRVLAHVGAKKQMADKKIPKNMYITNM
jgi:hypothetical protein